jgi:hypothetical protein
MNKMEEMEIFEHALVQCTLQDFFYFTRIVS